ncbi:STN domain-containing protein [Sphingomonas sp.]|uniref:STN domain-containing protein n=1 Tax=Sphingomonas sp. TaxID=28214 RepID=UPI003D6CBC7F
MRSARLTLWLWAIAAGSAAAVAPAVASGLDDRQHFTVPAQPLTEALAEFARESGVDVIYEGKLMAGLRSTAIDGSFTAPAALRVLLAGTGLTARYTGRKAAIVYRPDQPPPSVAFGVTGAPALRLDKAKVRASLIIGTANRAVFDAYGRRAQTEIRTALQGDPVIAQRQFAVEIRLEIDGTGQMGAVALLRGTGDLACDDRIARLLNGRHLSQPPPEGLHEPLRFQVTSARLAQRD